MPDYDRMTLAQAEDRPEDEARDLYLKYVGRAPDSLSDSSIQFRQEQEYIKVMLGMVPTLVGLSTPSFGAGGSSAQALAGPSLNVAKRIATTTTAAATTATTKAAATKMAQTPSEVFGVLTTIRDEEVASMSMYAEFAGAGRVDPALGIRGANKGTWFGNILNERVRYRVQMAISEGTLTPLLRWTRQGQRGVDFWLPQGIGYDLFPARGRYLLQHEASYVGAAQLDGTILRELWPLLYLRP
jgi:hypothetical protein